MILLHLSVSVIILDSLLFLLFCVILCVLPDGNKYVPTHRLGSFIHQWEFLSDFILYFMISTFLCEFASFVVHSEIVDFRHFSSPVVQHRDHVILSIEIEWELNMQRKRRVVYLIIPLKIMNIPITCSDDVSK